MNKVKEVSVSDKVRALRNFFCAYNDGEEGNDCHDDGCLHINVGKVRYCFDIDTTQRYSHKTNTKKISAYRKRLLKVLEVE